MSNDGLGKENKINFMITENSPVVAVDRKGYPSGDIPEIALVGRSNVGKSSLINCLMGRKNFARTSKQPGKTATINFYTVGSDKKLRIVDLPGYGYAKVSHKEQERWKKMINFYLENRPQLKMICLLVDLRHPPSQDDIMIWDYIKYSKDLENLVITTKCDKLSTLKFQENLEIIISDLGLDNSNKIIPFSSIHKIGREEIIEVMTDIALKSNA